MVHYFYDLLRFLLKIGQKSPLEEVSQASDFFIALNFIQIVTTPNPSLDSEFMQ